MKLKMNYLIATTFFVLGIFILSCNKKVEKSLSKRTISPPSEKLVKKAEEFIIKNPSKAIEFKLASGTILQIPENAFVDSEGKKITEKVSLKYKEYKDAVDILGSGIPMEYDSAGNEEILQTAGMFELYGFDASGKEVFIHPDKNLIVSMLTNPEQANYNFYTYDKTNNNWVYNSTSKISNTTIKTDDPKDKLPNPPIEPKQYDPAKYVIDMKMNLNDFPELKSMKNLMWQYAGNDSINDPNNNQWIFSKKWSDVKLTLVDAENSIFELQLSDSKKTFQTTVIPVLAGKNLKKAQAQFQAKMESYTNKYAERIAKEKEEAKTKEMMYRTVGIGNFGIYNYDRIFKNNVPRIAAKFEFEDNTEIEDATIYHLYGAAATVVRYPSEKWNSFSYTNLGGNCLVAFLKNGKVAVFTNQDFLKLDNDKIKTDKSVTFKMNSSPGISIDPEAMRKMVKL